MRKPIWYLGVLLLAAGTLAAQTETSGGQIIIGSGSTDTTYYAPAFAYGLQPSCNRYDSNGHLITGQCVFLYVQGDAKLGDNTYNDQLLMFWNPNTWTGLTTPFAGGKGECAPGPACDLLLPGTDYQGTPMPQGHYYGGPSVFGFNGKLYMTAMESLDGKYTFHKQWWGVSTDNVSWTWYPLFEYNGIANLNLPGVTLQPRFISGGGGGQWYFYGFLEVRSGEGIGTGAIRLRASFTKPRGYDRVEIYALGSGGASDAWTTIIADPDANPSGSFSGPVPKKLWDAEERPKYLENGELWFAVLNGPKTCPPGQCAWGSGSTLGWNDRLAYHVVTPPSDLTSPPSYSSTSYLGSAVRCSVGNYNYSRTNPMPLATGNPRLLYSATADLVYSQYNYCGGECAPCNPFAGMYIVVTGFQ